jgi:hypothetical protein
MSKIDINSQNGYMPSHKDTEKVGYHSVEKSISRVLGSGEHKAMNASNVVNGGYSSVKLPLANNTTKMQPIKVSQKPRETFLDYNTGNLTY